MLGFESKLFKDLHITSLEALSAKVSGELSDFKLMPKSSVELLCMIISSEFFLLNLGVIKM